MSRGGSRAAETVASFREVHLLGNAGPDAKVMPPLVVLTPSGAAGELKRLGVVLAARWPWTLSAAGLGVVLQTLFGPYDLLLGGLGAVVAALLLVRLIPLGPAVPFPERVRDGLRVVFGYSVLALLANCTAVYLGRLAEVWRGLVLGATVFAAAYDTVRGLQAWGLPVHSVLRALGRALQELGRRLENLGGPSPPTGA